MKGKIIKIISNDCTVLAENQTFICKPRGKFRKSNIAPKVGDIVEFDPQNLYLLKIEDRKNELVRPPVSNIDQAFIITSVKKPDFSSHLLDKLLTIITFHRIRPILCFTKMDLLNEQEKKEIDTYISYYKKIGYTVYENTEIEKIVEEFRGKISIFTGQSGAGKSTLLNRIDPSLQIKTDAISEALGRGKHTTRHVELIFLNGGFVADTPGFSSITFEGMTKADIRDCFVEFSKRNCAFRDCMHDKEEDCVLKDQVGSEILFSRYENYLKFIKEEAKR